MTAPTTTLSDKDLEFLETFHGHICPMVLVGARLGRVAAAGLRDIEDSRDLPFAFFRGGGCAVDGVQAATGCTWGNGNLILLRGRDLSLILTREGWDRAILAIPRSPVLEGAREARGKVLGSPFATWIMEGDRDDLFTVEVTAGPADLSRFPER